MQFSSAGSSSSLSPASLQHASGTRRPRPSSRAADTNLANQRSVWVNSSASKSSIRRFVITEKAPTRAFSWLKAPTSAFTFKTLLRHYAKRALNPRSLNVKLGPPRNYHKERGGLVSIVSYSRTSLMIISSRTQFHVYLPWDQCPFSISLNSVLNVNVVEAFSVITNLRVDVFEALVSDQISTFYSIYLLLNISVV